MSPDDIPANPYFPQPGAHGSDPGHPEPQPSDPDGPSLSVRYVTQSPVEEFLSREGRTRQLHPAFQAYMCDARRGVATVTAKGVTLRKKDLVGAHNTGEKRRYWSLDSILCNDLHAGEELKVFYVFNPADPDLIHLLDRKTGTYLESLPAVDRPAWFDEEALRREHADALTAQRRAADHLQRIHQEDSVAAVTRAQENAAEMQRIANRLELPRDARPGDPDSQPSPALRGIDQAVRKHRDAEADRRTATRDADTFLDRNTSTREPQTQEQPYDPIEKA